jgi:hypothetical protein
MGLNFWASLGYSNTVLDNFTSVSVSQLSLTINATGGRTAGPSLRFTTVNNGFANSGRAIAALLTPGPTQYACENYKTTSLPASTDRVIFEFRESNAVQVDIRITPTGQLRVTRNGTTLATSTSQVIFANVNFQYEIKVLIHNSTGTIDVRQAGDVAGIPGLTGITEDTQATANATIDAIAYVDSGTSESHTSDHCDMTVRDDDWSGDTHWSYLPFDTAGNYAQWTPSAGANHQTIDETGSPTADNNATDVVGEIDSFAGAAGSVPATSTIIAACPIVLANKQDAGAAQIEFFFRQGGVDYTPGAAFNPPFGSDAYVKEAYPLNPATGLPFTPTEINGTLERGYKRSA